MKKLFYVSNLLTLCLILCSASAKAQAPVISAGPVSDTVCSGTSARFTVMSTDTAAVYVWEVFSGTTWDTVHDGSTYSGESNDTLFVTSTLSLSGNMYRVFAYNTSGVSASSDTATLIVNPLPAAGTLSGTSAICVGATSALSSSISGGTWSLSATGATTISTAGVVTGVAVGVDTAHYTVVNSCGTATASYPLTISTVSTAAITGASTVCVGFTTALADATTGGTWSNLHSSVLTISASGVVTGVAVGVDTISYTVTNSCGSAIATHIVTVGTSSVGAITGASNVCVGASITLSDTTSGGTWSSSNPSLATVSTTGDVHGIATGLDTIMYSVTTSCGMVTVSFPVTIYTVAVGAVTGAGTVCVGSSISLSDTTAGGSWSSSDTTVATVSSTGSVTGVANGTATISYMVTTACGAVTMTHSVVVGTVALPAITGPTHVCISSMITLANATTGGTWTSVDTSIATISSTGMVMAVASGTDSIVYTVTTSCGAISTYYVITVDSAIGAAPILGPSTVCVGSFITQTNANAGGTWSVSNSNATISTTGLLSGVAAGLDTVMYVFASTCGSDTSWRVVTIDTPITAGSISGASGVCVGSWVAYTATVTGGSWLSSNASIASPDASGFVTGRGQGTAIISYLFSNSCGSFVATHSITVDRTASVITGNDSVGVGFTRTLSDSVSGGTWTSSDTTFATVDAAGVVTGVAVGSATITYTVSNICGTSWASKLIHVGVAPTAGGITGPDSVCAGSSITLADTISGGVWGITNTVAAGVTSAGVVNGILGHVLDTVTYTVSNGFGSTTAWKEVYINDKPIITFGTIPTTFVLGSLYSISASPAGGTWMSLNDTNVTFVTVTGFVPLRLKNTKIVYTVSNTCGTSKDTIDIRLGAAGVENVNGSDNATLNIFPNPNNGAFELNVASAYTENASVVVTNMVGKSVKQFTVSTNKTTSVSLDQPSGIYFVTVTTGHGKYTAKVTVTE